MNGKSCSFLKRCPLVFEMVKGRCFLLNKGKEEKQESYIINHISKLVISPRLRHICSRTVRHKKYTTYDHTRR